MSLTDPARVHRLFCRRPSGDEERREREGLGSVEREGGG